MVTVVVLLIAHYSTRSAAARGLAALECVEASPAGVNVLIGGGDILIFIGTVMLYRQRFL